MPMQCRDVRELIEALAAGERETDPAVSEHLATCAGCAQTLALARRIDRLLATREAPAAPPRFVANVLSRVSQDRWRAERSLDLWFNVAIAAGILLVVGGIVMLMNLSGLGVVVADASSLMGAGVGLLAERIEAALPTYVAATALLLTALGVWWWAEGSFSW